MPADVDWGCIYMALIVYLMLLGDTHSFFCSFVGLITYLFIQETFIGL